ncbi:DUF1385 domain-containing protein [Alteribacter natronophilus]|uniref:DUF1385 domain-containing protein n=1 Tax=Alteribacter natronophilus TaxID=2583810 RepID=UPI00110ED18E|nr:DUF1385 domain-containing protein [Alteribacter natronophilus]TMW73764.1 DUF1385 domain-containing protein [Alteribacter natronophilus]
MSKQTETPAYGGQAVMEGVMFGGKNTTVTAIRRNDNSLDFFEVKKKKRPWVEKLKKIPFLRGVAAIVEASANGTKHLNFSTERYDVNPEDDDQIESTEQTSKLTMILGVAAVGVLTFIFGKLIFTALPAALAELFRPVFPGHVAQNLIEGFIKLIFLLSYIYIISLTPLIKRVFQYHGAEHKVINAFENGKELNVQNVQDQSRLHYRCGSSFILFTVIVGVFIYLAVPSEPLWERLTYRIALIPVVLGASYEVLQLTNRVRNVPSLRWLGYPGLWLQLLTTKEPKDAQVEVAIASFEEMRKRDAAPAEDNPVNRIV